MRKIVIKYLPVLMLSILFFFSSFMPDVKKTRVYKFDMKENISKATWRKTKQAFAEADSVKADLFLIHMNTYGGTVLDADSIRTKILASKIPVYVFIDNNAASAGALISIACDGIYMRPGSSMGATTVVNQTGEAMPDKYQSYMRSTMRSTAEAHGKDTVVVGQDTTYIWKRDPKIAEAMVDQRIFVEGISDTGRVLTFTPSEAMENNYCEGIAEDTDEVLHMVGVEEYEIVEYKASILELIIGFLVLPMVSGLLIMGIIGGIYFEMQSPGIGFPLGVAIIAAVLYFAPLYLEGLAANWEILIFIIGLILIAVEIFVIPGFGIAGALGIVLTFAGLVLSLLGNVNFDFKPVDTSRISIALATVIVAILGGLFLSLYLGDKMFSARKGLFKGMSLKTVQDAEEGFISIDTSLLKLKGAQGVAKTVLRPSGKVLIGGEIYDAVAESGFIEKDEAVVVHKVEATQLYVEREDSI